MYAGTLIVVTSMVGSLLLLFLIRRYLHAGRTFEAHNDVTGVCVTMIGTLIAVILAFMVFAVWNRFETAKSTVEHESVEMIATYRIAGGLPDTARERVRNVLRSYAVSVRDEEWPAMSRSKVGPMTRGLIEDLYNDVLAIEPKTNSQYILDDHILYTVTDISTDRSTRLVLSQAGLPMGLWIVMIVGSSLTVIAFCFHWVERASVHYVLVCMMAGMVALVLFTIKMLDRPFSGTVTVSPVPIQHAIDYFDSHSGKHATVSSLKSTKPSVESHPPKFVPLTGRR